MNILKNRTFRDIGLFLPLALCYFAGLPTSLPDFDAGEFALLAVKGGIAHPPGYPLLTLILRSVVMMFQKFVPLIPLLACVSIFFTIAAAIITHKIARAYTRNETASLFGVYLVFLTGIIWKSATAIEPFEYGTFTLFAGPTGHILWGNDSLPCQFYFWQCPPPFLWPCCKTTCRKSFSSS